MAFILLGLGPFFRTHYPFLLFFFSLWDRNVDVNPMPIPPLLFGSAELVQFVKVPSWRGMWLRMNCTSHLTHI